MTVFGTRPEVIKVAPVIRQLESIGVETINVSSAQHRDLIQPLIEHFDLRIDHDLDVMRPNQTLSGTSARVLNTIDPILESERPDVVLVQGDTTTALVAAQAAWNRRCPVGHIEAGLRSGDATNPFPEEMNRRLISQLATFHFAATTRNQQTLLSEGIDRNQVFVTGNPVIDALHWTLQRPRDLQDNDQIDLQAIGQRIILLTTHRRESFGDSMRANLEVMADFVSEREDVSIVFPVHPNPAVRQAAEEILGNRPRIHLFEPLAYPEFVVWMKRAWMLVSDSGGLQEEAPSLGKPLLVLRKNTERPEAVDCGATRLTDGSATKLKEELTTHYLSNEWADQVRQLENPFGDGSAAERISSALLQHAARVS
ncbi:MAG: UDP-N-acetylglucosamine 2-epimerase (non-hydrolyzing) [Verrucomicrobiota bacterium]